MRVSHWMLYPWLHGCGLVAGCFAAWIAAKAPDKRSLDTAGRSVILLPHGREAAIQQFNAPDSKAFIFLLSIRAAGRGLNLQSADTVVRAAARGLPVPQHVTNILSPQVLPAGRAHICVAERCISAGRHRQVQMWRS